MPRGLLARWLSRQKRRHKQAQRKMRAAAPFRVRRAANGGRAAGKKRKFQNKRRKMPRGYTPTSGGDLRLLQGIWLYFWSACSFYMHTVIINYKKTCRRIVCAHFHFFSQTYSIVPSVSVTAPVTRLSHLLPFPLLPTSCPQQSHAGAVLTAPRISSLLTQMMSTVPQLPSPLPNPACFIHHIRLILGKPSSDSAPSACILSPLLDCQCLWGRTCVGVIFVPLIAPINKYFLKE